MEKSVARRDRYFGYGDISFFISEIVYSLFDFSNTETTDPKITMTDKSRKSSCREKCSEGIKKFPNHLRDEKDKKKKELIELPDFVAYILLRTALPQSIIFHALHLLGRLSYTFPSNSLTGLPRPINPTTSCTSQTLRIPDDQLSHYFLILSLLLSTVYNMDNSYSNVSWSIASRNLFSREQIDYGCLWMLKTLGWVLRIPEERSSIDGRVLIGQEDLRQVDFKWSEAFEEWKGDERVHPIYSSHELTSPVMTRVKEEGVSSGGGGGRKRLSIASIESNGTLNSLMTPTMTNFTSITSPTSPLSRTTVTSSEDFLSPTTFSNLSPPRSIKDLNSNLNDPASYVPFDRNGLKVSSSTSAATTTTPSPTSSRRPTSRSQSIGRRAKSRLSADLSSFQDALGAGEDVWHSTVTAVKRLSRTLSGRTSNGPSPFIKRS